MTAPLVPVQIESIYKAASGAALQLPARMAHATPDMKAAIAALDMALRASPKKGKLVLSDLFRSYDMQTQAHLDYVSGRKKAYSPPAGASLHEAGRAFDLDLSQIKVTLADCWALGKPAGLVPIIDTPNAKLSESWHFECRGSHQRVYDYYKAGKGTNFPKPYTAMAASAIVSAGIQVDKFGSGQVDAYIQSCAIRLGATIGNLDGQVGPKTRDGLKAIGITAPDKPGLLAAVEDAAQRAFPTEYFDATQ